eukprot:TRINITY_DN223_c0_g1_i3.p1 TRINITY_DN223_c0_g1~~TRINITY_DN223_c0_g1_i3.p1  ORF type:complete len:212 (+),score=25.07 TRINITY_DN223_c0_g1_i3:1231-1866(+)
MAVNIPLTGGVQRYPLPFPGELFLLTRDKTEVTVKHAGHTAKHLKGRLYMTNMRIVFMVAPEQAQKARFETFEVPFRGIINEAFNQPIFGCNNLTAGVLYYEGQPFMGDLTMRIDFVRGGVNTFMPVFNNVLLAVRQQMARESQANQYSPPVHPTTTTPQVEQYFPSHNSAFIDPHDPSTIYTTQPVGEETRRQDVPSWHVSAQGLRSRRH